MYLRHYNLKEKPFNISPDSRFLWMSDKHKEGLASLKYGVMENKGFLVLTGDIGTGKTLLINALIRITEVQAIIATIPDPDLEILDFFKLLAEEFDMDKSFSSKGEFLVRFKQFLLNSYASDKTVLLIVDEAQRLNSELLEQIRLLSNIELDNKKLLNIFFVGQREFNQLLLDEKNKAVRQRITVFYQLKPLSEPETAAYIQHRLKQAGATAEIFDPTAIREVYKFSHGTPRLINVICDLALLTGFSNDLKKINAAIIKDCAKELQLPTELAGIPQKPPRPKEDHSNLNLAALQQKELTGIRGGIIFIGIVFFLFVAYQIYDSISDRPLPWKDEQVEMQKKFEPPSDVSKAFQSHKETLEEMKLESAESIPTPQKEEDAPAAVEPESDAEISDTVDPQMVQSSAPLAAVEPEIDAEINSTVDPQMAQSNAPPADAVVDQKTIIYFDHNSNELPENAYETLDEIVRFTSQRPNLKITVEGYTDSYGNAIYNKQLSQYRADMVKNYLIGNGIAPAKISAHGRGSDNPIKPNATFEGRKQNRRVEIKINSE
jgi:general secretion pathway protein A